ncbi:MAG: hypothetical protein HYU84_16845 [Chloroflexi bacterium]|nr:hypothetical protein [Chloroflexota bacterium]MBI3169940.1 hypothetical protein [Chloroflexota bacterium]
MELQHINLKFFIENPESLDLEKFHGVFNSWIQRSLTDDLLVDVAEYLHVHNGPGILLIGHNANYSLDQTAGRLGLLYNRKEQVSGTNKQKLAQAAHAALSAMQILEKENRIRFIGNQVQLVINDRLVALNTAETFAELKADLDAFFGTLFKSSNVTLVHNSSSEPRARFAIDASARLSTGSQSASAFDTQFLLDNISAELEPVHA